MDDALSDRAHALQADEFEALFLSQFKRLARLVRRVVADPAEAEDLAADVLWKCFRKQPAAIHLEGWLSRAAVRAALDSTRRKTRRSRYESLWPWRSHAARPDELLERERESEHVRQVLGAIKPRFATLDYRELAEALGVKPASVGTLLARAEACFRKEYVRRHGPQ
jgi:RNA polymerase sigma-70 factor, ECF subfamily